ncbi:MAG: hypothetical protein V4679_24305 [Pseudomonadota bacterium]
MLSAVTLLALLALLGALPQGHPLRRNACRVASALALACTLRLPGTAWWRRHAAAQETAGLGNRRLQIGRSGPSFTVFLPHSLAMGLQIRQKLSSLRPFFAFGAPSPAGS